MAISNELRQGLNLLTSKDEAAREQGFSILYNNTYNEVYRKALYIMKNEDDALDLTQEVFVQAYRGIDSLENAENIHAWLGGIVHNQGMKIFRKKRNEVLVDEEAEGIFDAQITSDESAIPGTREEREATAKVVMSFIDTLPELQRGAVLAFYYDNMKIDDIARIYECSPNTIKSRLNYAKKAIKDLAEAHEKRYQYKLCSISPAIILLAFRSLFATERYALYMLSSNVTGSVGAMAIYEKACLQLGIKPVAMAGQAGVAGAASTTGVGNAGVAGAATGSTGVANGVAGAATSVATKVGLGIGAKIAIAAGAVVVAGGVAFGGYEVAKNLNKPAEPIPVPWEGNNDLDDDTDVDDFIPDEGDEDEPQQAEGTFYHIKETSDPSEISTLNAYSDILNSEIEISFFLEGDEAGDLYPACFSYGGTKYYVQAEALGMSGYYVEQDGDIWLIAAPYEFNEYTNIYVYKLDQETNTFRQSMKMQGSQIVDFEDTNHIKIYLNVDTVGFNGGTKNYQITEDGLYTSDGEYDLTSNYWGGTPQPLVTKLPLEVTIDGATETLPAGTSLYAKASTDGNHFIFTLDDGREGWFAFTTDNWVEINGTPVMDYFEEVYYAG